VRVTWLPLGKEALHPFPPEPLQDIPAGCETIIPEPPLMEPKATVNVTVGLDVEGETEKLAATIVFVLRDTTQALPVPMHPPPLHPEKVEGETGVSVKTI
jgi:hypothetical protein